MEKEHDEEAEPDTLRIRKMSYLVTGIFKRESSAQIAITDLVQQLGYQPEDICVLMGDPVKTREFAARTGVRPEDQPACTAAAAGSGAGLGAIVGAVLAGVAGTGYLAAVTGTGGAEAPFLFGPFEALVGGAGAGAIAGGLIGGVSGAGIAEGLARQFLSPLRDGSIVLAVRADDVQLDVVQQTLYKDQAILVDAPGQRPRNHVT